MGILVPAALENTV